MIRRRQSCKPGMRPPRVTRLTRKFSSAHLRSVPAQSNYQRRLAQERERDLAIPMTGNPVVV